MVYVHRTLKRIISRAAALPPARLNDQDAFLLIKSLATLRYRGPEVSRIAQTATARLTANHQAYHIDLIVEWVTHLVSLQQRRHPLVMRVLLPRFVEVAPSTSPKTVQRALLTLTKLWAASDSHHTHHHVGGAKEDPFRAVADRLVRIAIQQLLSLTSSQQQDLALLKALASALPISSFRRKAMSVTMSEFLDKNHPLHAEIGSLSLLDWILLQLLGPHDNNDALLATPVPEATLFAHCANVVARSTGNDTFQLLCFTVCFTAVPKESQMSPTTQRLVQRFWDSLNIESSVPGGYASFLFQQLPNCCAAQSPDASSVDCVQRYLGPLVRKDSTLVKALNSYDLAKIASAMAEARWGRLFDSLGEHSKKLELLELLCRALDRLVTDAAFFVQVVAQQPPQPSNSERRPRTVDTVLIGSVIHATCALGAELSSMRVHSVSSHDFIPSIATWIVNLFSPSVVQHLLPATEGDHEDGERQQQRRSPGGELFIPATWCFLDLSRLARLPGCYDLAFQSLLSDLCRKIGQRVVAVGAEPSNSSKGGLLQTREMVQSLYAVTLLRTPGPLLELSSRDAEVSTLNRVQEWRTSSLDGGLTSIILEMFARKQLSLDSLTLGDWPMFLSVLANAAEMDREPQGQLQQQPTRLVVDTLVGWLQGQGGLPVQFHDLTLESGLSCCGSLLALSSVRSESLMAAKVLFNSVMTKCVGGLSTNSGEQQHRANIPNVAVVATFFSRWSKATSYDPLSNGGATSYDGGVQLNDVFGFQHRDLVQLWNAVVYPSLLLPRGGPLTVRSALRILESWVASRTKKNVRVLLVDHGVYSAQLHEQSRTVSANSTQVVPFPVETLLRYSLIDETLEVLGIVLPQLRRLQTYLARPRGASSATERAFFQSLARQQEQLVGLLVRQCIQTAFTSRDLLNNRTSCSPKQLTRLQLWLRCHEAEADSLLCLPNRSASLSLFVDTLHQFCGVLQQLVWHCSSGDDATEATNHSLHSHHPSEEVASDVSVSREGQRLEKTHHMDVQLLQFIVRSFADSALAVRTLDFFESSSASPNGMQSAEPEGFEVRRVKEDIRRLLDMLVVSNHVTALEVRSSIQKLSILF